MSDLVVPPAPALIAAGGGSPNLDPEPGFVGAGGGLDVVYVLSLMQVTFVLLAAVGEELLMGGSPAFLVMPFVKVALLLVFATKALRRRRWALRGLLVLEWITVAGFVLQLIGGLLPMIDFTVNLVGLLTNLLLPVVVIWLCRPYLVAIKKARRAARTYPVPQDPYQDVEPTTELAR